VGQPVVFSVQALAADGGVLSYAWDFGDGTTGNGSSATHTYAAPGIYGVRLAITNSPSGETASGVVSVRVASAGLPTGATLGSLYVAKAGLRVDWGRRASGAVADQLTVAGVLNPSGLPMLSAGACLTVWLNDVEVFSGTLSERGTASGPGSTGGTGLASVKVGSGAFAVSLRGADLAPLLGLAEATGTTAVPAALKLAFSGMAAETTAFTEFAIGFMLTVVSETDGLARGSFRYRTHETLNDVFRALKVVATSVPGGAYSVGVKAVLIPGAGRALVPTGPVTLRLGGHTVILDVTELDARDGNLVWSPGSVPELKAFAWQGVSRQLTLVTHALSGAETGIPAIAGAGSTHALDISMAIPTGSGLLTFADRVELVRRGTGWAR
jgi:PKD repeat protein